MKKFISVIFLIIIFIANFSLATYSEDVTMSVVEEPICEIEIGENSKFQKQLISKDLDNKEVTLQLKVTNEEKISNPSGELIMVLDNSYSTSEESATNSTRRELIYNSAKSLVTKLLEDNYSLKIGVVEFSSMLTTDFSKKGTINDAQLVCELSNDADKINTAISNITQSEEIATQTNLEAGLELAVQQFTTTNNNKYLIVLTDGIPNLSLFENDATTEEKSYYSDYTINRTKNKLLSIANSNIQLITMLTGINLPDSTVSGTTKTYADIIEEVFGTTESPTAGSFYYITDDEIEQTITEDIYNSLLPSTSTLKDITIVDYFPEEIINNFDFAYVTEANIGNISAKIDTTNNCITWTIPELKYGETAIVKYTLKLKDEFDSSIINQIIDTNKKVDITYTDINGKDQSDTSDVTPKLKITQTDTPSNTPSNNTNTTNNITNTTSKTNTTNNTSNTSTQSPTELPNTGTVTLTGFIILAGAISIYSLIRLIIINKKLK